MPTAMAACVPPQGRYAGTGGGPASIFQLQWGRPPQLYQGVMTTTFFLDFSDASSWKYRYLSDFAGPALGVTTIDPPKPPPIGRTPENGSAVIPFLRRGEGSIGAVAVWRSKLADKTPTSPPTGWEALDPVSCTATLRIDGVRYVGFSGINLSSPLGQPEKYFDYYSMTVTQNGDVITLIRDNSMSQPNTGFSVRLERQ
jgi:hypothetical protein